MEIFSSNFSENIPGLELAELVSLLGALALASIRIGSFFLASPLLGYRIVPLQVRIIVSFAMSFLIYDKVSMPDINQLAGLKIMAII